MVKYNNLKFYHFYQLFNSILFYSNYYLVSLKEKSYLEFTIMYRAWIIKDILIYFIDDIKIAGRYDSSTSTFQIMVHIWRDETQISNQKFLHSPSFNLNEWNYFGVSIFRTNRREASYDIHIVSKTMSGVENQDSFVGVLTQDLIPPILCESIHDYLYFFTLGFIYTLLALMII